MIAHQLTAVASGSLREELLLYSGQVPGISVQHQTLEQREEETPAQAGSSSTSGNSMVQAIIQTLAQLGLKLPLSSSSSTGTTWSDTNTAASGGTQGSNANSHAASLSDADIDSVFEKFIGQILQIASSPQQDATSSLASQSNSGNQRNGASATDYSNPLAQALESLALAVGAGSSQPGNASGNSETGSTTSLNKAISSLEQDFNTLCGSSGTGNSASLQIFLQTLASNVAQESASGSSGDFVRTSA